MRVVLWLTLLAAISCPVAEAAGVNLALGQPTAASSVWSVQFPSLAVDGVWGTHWNAGGGGSVETPHWLSVDLEALYMVFSIVLVSHHPWTEQANVYNLYGTTDGSTWSLLHWSGLADSPTVVQTIDTGAALLRGVKYEVIGGHHWAHLAEMEVIGVPEPSSFLLLAGGLGLLAIRYRRAAR
jgi:hypothetical protein